MGTRDVFSEEELAQLRAFPEIGRVDLIRHFTLTDVDEAFVRARSPVAELFPVGIKATSVPDRAGVR
ncbi:MULTISPECIES: hypothetical protein [Micromonospora]|uniref:hypothetical protein n=1 Tax=Micromonospora TaxID=1873 RepID=UPI000828877A|nr:MULTISPECIES: hypothetical protein [Micromonospora]MDG4756216.1 hypothetical protein [Micromonospora sp. WMMD718]SCL43304.1 hypothetical protein GA0070615_6390 [Micromonospora aurantiaca]